MENDLKYYNSMVVFEEIPDEVTLAINISNCPWRCEGCHSKFLWEDVGTPLNKTTIMSLLEENKGISCVCFMGGDINPQQINELAVQVKNAGLKTGWYSGFEEIPDGIDIQNFKYVKLGKYVEKLGGLNNPKTNQRMFRIEDDGRMKDITSNFWR